jgi:DNA invertase Pin-like site-specific DNA recombinase
MNRAVRYLRVSTEEQNEDNQIRAVDEYIKKNGWELVDTYRDHGVSAYKEDVRRPDFERMITDAKKKKFEHIVVFNLDRFSRQKEQEVLNLLKTLRMVYNVEVNAVYGDEWRDVVEMINNLPNMGSMGNAISEFIEKLVVGMQARQARLESEKISKRVLESKKFQKAKEEGRMGRPETDEDVQTIIVDLLSEDVPYDGIRSQLEFNGYKVPSEAKVSLIRKRYFKKPIQNLQEQNSEKKTL